MKYFITILLAASMISCAGTKNNFEGKTFKHTYMFLTSMNEYGKGGGSQFIEIMFKNDSINISNIDMKVSATENGGHDTKRSIISSIKLGYRLSGNDIIIDYPMLPKLTIKNDTLVAPFLTVNVNGNPMRIENAVFRRE